MAIVDPLTIITMRRSRQPIAASHVVSGELISMRQLNGGDKKSMRIIPM
jgi:hypothetical protein